MPNAYTLDTPIIPDAYECACVTASALYFVNIFRPTESTSTRGGRGGFAFSSGDNRPSECFTFGGACGNSCNCVHMFCAHNTNGTWPAALRFPLHPMRSFHALSCSLFFFPRRICFHLAFPSAGCVPFHVRRRQRRIFSLMSCKSLIRLSSREQTPRNPFVRHNWVMFRTLRSE